MAADGGGGDAFLTGNAFCADSETLPVSKNTAIKPTNARWAGVEKVVRFIKLAREYAKTIGKSVVKAARAIAPIVLPVSHIQFQCQIF